MKFLQIIFFVILISCGNSTTGENPADEGTASAEEQTSETNSAGPVDQEPVMGGPTKIRLNIKNVSDAKSYLISSVAGGNFRVDSSQIVNGKLTFEKKEGYPQGLYFASLPNNEFVQMFLPADQEFELEFDAADITGTMQVKGSKDNELYYENLRFEAGYNPQYQVLTRQMNAMKNKESDAYLGLLKERDALEEKRKRHLEDLFRGNEDMLFVKFKSAGQNPDVRESGTDAEKVHFYRKEFWDNVDFTDRRLLRTPVVSNKLKRYMTELTVQNPDSIISSADMLLKKVPLNSEYYKFFTNWIAIQFEPTKTQLMDPEAVFVHMIQKYFTRDKAFWADSMEVYALQQRAFEMGQSLVGLKGPDVISQDQYGKTQSIYSKKADYIVVYMYNPTCEHCMKETPLLVEWYNKNKNKGVDVFAIAVDTDDAEWKEYIRKNNMNFTNVFEPTNKSIYAKYYVDVTPEIYVLNKDRTIIGKNLKVFQIDTVIERDRNGT